MLETHRETEEQRAREEGREARTRISTNREPAHVD